MFSDSRWKHNQAFAAMSLNVYTEKKYTCFQNNVIFTFWYYIAVTVFMSSANFKAFWTPFKNLY